MVFVIANGANPDGMLPYAAFHLGLHCLPNYLFTIYRMKMVKIKMGEVQSFQNPDF